MTSTDPPAAFLRGASILYELEPGEITIGRADSNDIVLSSSKSISGNHAKLIVRGGARQHARLVDIGSMNGTFVNETLIRDSTRDIQSGDIIRFGYDTETYRFDFYDEDKLDDDVGSSIPAHQIQPHISQPDERAVRSSTMSATRQGPYSSPNDSVHSPAAGKHSLNGQLKFNNFSPPRMSREYGSVGQEGSIMRDILYGGGYGPDNDTEETNLKMPHRRRSTNSIPINLSRKSRNDKSNQYVSRSLSPSNHGDKPIRWTSNYHSSDASDEHDFERGENMVVSGNQNARGVDITVSDDQVSAAGSPVRPRSTRESLREQIRRDRAEARRERFKDASAASHSAIEAASASMRQLHEFFDRDEQKSQTEAQKEKKVSKDTQNDTVYFQSAFGRTSSTDKVFTKGDDAASSPKRISPHAGVTSSPVHSTGHDRISTEQPLFTFEDDSILNSPTREIDHQNLYSPSERIPQKDMTGHSTNLQSHQKTVYPPNHSEKQTILSKDSPLNESFNSRPERENMQPVNSSAGDDQAHMSWWNQAEERNSDENKIDNSMPDNAKINPPSRIQGSTQPPSNTSTSRCISSSSSTAKQQPSLDTQKQSVTNAAYPVTSSASQQQQASEILKNPVSSLPPNKDATVPSTLSPTEIEALQNDLRIATQQKDYLQNELDRLHTTQQNSHTALDSAEQEIQSLRAQLQQAQTDKNDIAKRLETVVQRERDHGRDITDLTKKITSLRSLAVATAHKGALLALNASIRHIVSRKLREAWTKWCLVTKRSADLDHTRTLSALNQERNEYNPTNDQKKLHKASEEDQKKLHKASEEDQKKRPETSEEGKSDDWSESSSQYPKMKHSRPSFSSSTDEITDTDGLKKKLRQKNRELGRLYHVLAKIAALESSSEDLSHSSDESEQSDNESTLNRPNSGFASRRESVSNARTNAKNKTESGRSPRHTRMPNESDGLQHVSSADGNDSTASCVNSETAHTLALKELYRALQRNLRHHEHTQTSRRSRQRKHKDHVPSAFVHIPSGNQSIESLSDDSDEKTRQKSLSRRDRAATSHNPLLKDQTDSKDNIENEQINAHTTRRDVFAAALTRELDLQKKQRLRMAQNGFFPHIAETKSSNAAAHSQHPSYPSFPMPWYTSIQPPMSSVRDTHQTQNYPTQPNTPNAHPTQTYFMPPNAPSIHQTHTYHPMPQNTPNTRQTHNYPMESHPQYTKTSIHSMYPVNGMSHPQSMRVQPNKLSDTSVPAYPLHGQYPYNVSGIYP